MSFATINGWALPVRDGTARGERQQHGNLSESWTNRPNRNRTGSPRSWRMTTAKVAPDVADTLEALLDGRGHRFSFDDNVTSSAGLVPQGGAGTFSFPGQLTSPPVFGRSHLYISAGSVIWNPGFYDGKWTVMYFRDVDTTAEHVVVRSDGAKWLDNVRNDAAVTTELTVSNGAVQLDVGHYDELVLLPYAASASLIESGAGYGDTFSDLPNLKLSGDIVGGDVVEVRGKEDGSGYIQHGSPIGWVNNAREVACLFDERRAYEPQLFTSTRLTCSMSVTSRLGTFGRSPLAGSRRLGLA